jgi:hypothetical protein
MNLTYEYENYEIKINKMTDSVYIEFYDNKLYKTFSNTFLDTDIVTITGKSIDTFYTVMNTVFSALIDKDFEKSTLNIILFNKQIKLDIHHKYYIDLKFELELNLNKENSLNDKNICLKKLEDKIKLLEIKNDQLTKQLTKLEDSCSKNICFEELEDKFEDIIRSLVIKNDQFTNQLIKLEEFIDNYMQVCIYHESHPGGLGRYSVSLIIPIKCNNIIISEPVHANDIPRMFIGNDNITYLSIRKSAYKILKVFKIVKCDTLTLEGNNIECSLLILPLSIKKLIIKNYKSILPFELPNLINLELIDCTFEFIYAKISHFKTLKNITLQ